jgi:2-oxo-4-hydroxy-4-carboxy-5-ureidoimidazoline decarboxylase
MEEGFRIAEVNRLPAVDLICPFTRCLAVRRWAEELAESRPYPDVAALLARADELSARLTDAEVRAALADHPRIGERTAAGSMSAREQSGVDAQDADRLRAANLEYEERFGHIYLVCAGGRGSAELLADLRERLANDPVTELGVVRRELGRIARLRLAGMMSG